MIDPFVRDMPRPSNVSNNPLRREETLKLVKEAIRKSVADLDELSVRTRGVRGLGEAELLECQDAIEVEMEAHVFMHGMRIQRMSSQRRRAVRPMPFPAAAAKLSCRVSARCRDCFNPFNTGEPMADLTNPCLDS